MTVSLHNDRRSYKENQAQQDIVQCSKQNKILFPTEQCNITIVGHIKPHCTCFNVTDKTVYGRTHTKTTVSIIAHRSAIYAWCVILLFLYFMKSHQLSNLKHLLMCEGLAQDSYLITILSLHMCCNRSTQANLLWVNTHRAACTFWLRTALSFAGLTLLPSVSWPWAELPATILWRRIVADKLPLSSSISKVLNQWVCSKMLCCKVYNWPLTRHKV